MLVAEKVMFGKPSAVKGVAHSSVAKGFVDVRGSIQSLPNNLQSSGK
jgi:hypothetical protein